MASVTHENGWDYVGQHSFKFEQPDFVYFRPVGFVSLEDAETFIIWVEKHVQPGRGIYLLTDVAPSTGQSSDIVKSKDLMQRIRVFRALAYFGVNFRARTAMSIYVRIARFFGFPLADIPLAVFTTEQEARVWLEECRAKHLAKT
jgi:hypothetical protein